jgi:hypothetical protein
MKKLILLFCAVVWFAAAGFAQVGGTIEGTTLTWELDGFGTLTIRGNGEIPDLIGFDAAWNPYAQNIKVIKIEQGVTSIGASAFEFGGGQLTSVYIPQSMWFIAPNFVHANTFTEFIVEVNNPNYYSSDGVLFEKRYPDIVLHTYPEGKQGAYIIPNSVTRIGSLAFDSCQGLTSVNIPGSVRWIEGQAFGYCFNLTSVNIPNSVTTIEMRAFAECPNLAPAITIPSSVTSIGDGAFENCRSITAIDVDVNNPAYSSANGVLFDKGKTLLHTYPAGKPVENYDIPNTVTNIGNYAFEGCYHLTSVTIPGSVISIGIFAFYNSNGLTSLTIPASVTSLGYGALMSFHLTSLEVKWETPLTVPADLFYAPILPQATLIVPAGTKALYQAAPVWRDFGTIVENLSSPCDSPLASGTIGSLRWTLCPDGTLTIRGNGEIPDFITTDAPWNPYAQNIKVIKIEQGVTGIGAAAFDLNIPDSQLTSVYIPQSMQYISSNAVNALSFTEFIVDVNNPFYYSSDGVLFQNRYPDVILYTYPQGKQGAVYTIPNSVTRIGQAAFFSCYNLTSVNIPNSVTRIGVQAFAYSSYLTSVNIPNSVTNIETLAFMDCSNLAPTITIPSSVTSIGDGAFENCSRLTAIDVDVNNSAYSSVNGVVFDKDKTLLHTYPAGKTAENYDIPNTVTNIGNYAFLGCYHLTSVTIPGSVISIGNSVFNRCYSLTSLTIPASVTSIGYYALSNFYLTSLEVQWKTPLTVAANILNPEFKYASATLIVPAGTKALYQAAPVWQDFGTIIEKGIKTDLVWTGAAGTSAWNTPGNWSNNQVPGSAAVVEIPGGLSNYPVLTATTAVGEIHFQPGAEIGNQHFLNNYKAFVQYDFKANSTRNRWHMLSVPLQEAYPGDFTFGGYPLTWVRNFTTEKDNGGVAQAGWETAHRNTTPFGAGSGFVVWLDEEDGGKGLKLSDGILELPFFADPESANVHYTQEYSELTGKSTFYNFKPVNGGGYEKDLSENQRYEVDRTTSAYLLAGADVNEDLRFGADNGGLEFALVGNPFMASLDFNNLQAANSEKIAPTYQVWTGAGYTGYSISVNSHAFGILNRASVADPLTHYIAPLQSFIVQKTVGFEPGENEVLAFNTSMTEVNTAKLRSVASDANTLDIVARNEEAEVLTFIAQREGGQTALCNLDARKLMNGISRVPEIYTLKPSGNGRTAVGANLIDGNNQLIPLGLATSYAGDISFTFTGMDNYQAAISLVDIAANREIDLTGLDSYEYTFHYTPAQSNGQVVANEDRFFIRFSPTNLTGLPELASASITVYGTEGLIHLVSSNANPINQVSAYNLQGALVYESEALNTAYYTTRQALAPGVYVVKVVSKKGVQNVKLVIKS